MKSIFNKRVLLAGCLGLSMFAHAMDLKDGDKVAVLSGQNFEIWSCGTYGYIRLLINELAKEGVQHSPLILLEWQKTDQMLARLDSEVIAKGPVVAVIIPGSADYNAGVAETVSESFRNNLETIIGKLKAASIKTALVTSYESNSDPANARNLNVVKHNEVIRSLAKEHDLFLIDLVKNIDSEERVVPFNRSLVARAVVNQMLAGEIMRVIGYSDQEVAACRMAWCLELTPSVSNNTYAKLKAAAKAAGKDVDAYITELLHNSVK